MIPKTDCGPVMIDLFAGIGGFSLAGHWAGFRTELFCEIEPFCRKVLNKNFPGVPVHDDIRTLDATPLVGRIDVVAGGFPCQDISPAGHGAGIDGARSGLVVEMLRIIRECRPAWVVAENSHHLRTKGADRVLGGLEAFGYTARAVVVGAGHAGAPHQRKRGFIVATDGDGLRQLQQERSLRAIGGWDHHGPSPRRMASDGPVRGRDEEPPASISIGGARAFGAGSSPHSPWGVRQPPPAGVVDGLRGRLDRSRIHALGNTVVPQVAYVFLKAIADQLRGPCKEDERSK